MKRFASLISAVAILSAMASCQHDVLPAEPSEGDTVTTKVEVSVPGALKTKAFGEAAGLNSVNYEIWNEDFTELVTKDEVALDAELKGTLELKLIRFKTYNVLFWAQGEGAKHTWTNLKEINVDYTANVENDAFAGRVLNINATNDMNLTHTVVLTRPFAQVNFATDDLGEINMGTLALKSAKVTVPGLATTYDLINGVGVTPKDVTFTSTAVLTEPFVMNETEYDHVLVFYPLVAEGESATVNLTAEFEVTCGEEVIPISWTGKGAMNNVPVQADYRTNFYGSLFTNSGTVSISVDNKFNSVSEPNFDIDTKTIAELESAAEGTYLLEGSVTTVAAAGEGKEDVTITDASAQSITLTLSTEDVEVAVKAAATHYQEGDVIKVIVEKTAEGVSALEVLNHSRDVADIYLAVAAGQNVTLTEDVELNHGPIVVAAGQEVTIDLGTFTLSNGKEIWNDTDWALISVQGGKLTLKGTGKVMAAENDCFAIDVREGGELVIEDGNYVGNISAVYVYEGKATINGGTFSAQQKSEFNDYRYLLNCLDVNYSAGTASISVTGGTFEGFNPQDNLAEGTATDFVAEGYVATAEGTTYTVAEKPAAVAPETSEALPFKSATMGDFTIRDVELGGLTYVWKEDTTNKYMKANAYSGGTDYTTESWLESPWFDLTSASAAYVSFSHCANYFKNATPEEHVGMYVKEFGGEWTAVAVDNWPSGSNWNWYDVELELTEYVGKYVQFAVKYISDAKVEAGTYEIKEFRIAETHKPTITVSQTSISAEAGDASATFEVTANCEWTAVSDNSDFTVAVSGNTVTVTFAANTTSTPKAATITVSGPEETTATVKVNQAGVVSGDAVTYTMISTVSELTSGTYYMAAYLTADSSNNDLSAYPYHLWTGGVSGTASSNSDLLTVNYSYTSNVLTLNPSLSDTDAAKGTAADVTIEAVAGKENTFYIKIGTQYLQHAVTGTNRRLVLTDTAAEWVASDHSAGGIQFVNNDAYMGTASANYNFIRSYKSASKSSVKYGLVFFKEN